MVLAYRSIEALTVQDACASILAAPKRRLGDAKLFDFIMQDGPELPGTHGVYFFFDADTTTCLYVGKNSAQQFIERIPWHFAMEGAWMNHFLKYYRQHHQSASLFEAAKGASDCHVLLMPAPREIITKAEKFLRAFLKPRFNTLASASRLQNSIPLDTSIGEATRSRI